MNQIGCKDFHIALFFLAMFFFLSGRAAKAMVRIHSPPSHFCSCGIDPSKRVSSFAQG